MGRREGPREGYVLLDRLRKQGDNTPLFFYASSNAREHKIETLEHGGQGCTNNGQELFEMVIRAVNLRRAE
jgi:DNA-binding response OmpR family regulator